MTSRGLPALGGAALMLWLASSCGGSANVDDGGAGGEGALPLCDGWDDCSQQLVSRIYDLPCYPKPGPTLSFTKPDEPVCGDAVEAYVVCMANDSHALLCPPGMGWQLSCGACVVQRAEVDASCQDPVSCSDG